MDATGISRTLIGAAALLAAALPAMAQQDGGKPVTGSGDVRVTSSGNIVLDHVYRSRELTTFTDSVSRNGGAPAIGTADAENTFEGHVAVRLDVEWGNNVAVVFEVGTKRIDDDPVNGGILRWGDAQARDFQVREARILFTDVFPGLQVEAGLSTWKFDVRGQGSSFAFDPRNSQTFDRNLGSDGSLNFSDDAESRLGEAAFINDHEVIGATFSYSVGGFVVHFVALPAHEERGSFSQDDSTYALDVWIPMDSLAPGSRAGLIVSVSKGPTDTFDSVAGGPLGNQNEHTKVYTVGGGTSIKVMPGLEVFAEGYINTGKAGELDNGTTVKAKGKAFQGGVEWHYLVGNPMPFWFNFTYFYLSGEDGVTADNDEAGKFASYENINDLMILEDRFFGFDWDSNYKGFKISGGTSFSVAQENDLEARFIVGITRLSEDISAGPTTPAENLTLGNEVDLRLNWSLNKQFVIRFSAAFLFDSEVLEAGLRGPTGSSPDEAKTAQIFVFGFDLTF